MMCTRAHEILCRAARVMGHRRVVTESCDSPSNRRRSQENKPPSFLSDQGRRAHQGNRTESIDYVLPYLSYLLTSGEGSSVSFRSLGLSHLNLSGLTNSKSPYVCARVVRQPRRFVATRVHFDKETRCALHGGMLVVSYSTRDDHQVAKPDTSRQSLGGGV
jgi:hypothetical protein